MTSPVRLAWQATNKPPAIPKAVVLDYGGVLAPDGHSAVLPAAVEVVTALAGRGIALILASNTGRTQPVGIRTRQLEEAGIAACFAVIFESEHLRYAKPDPRFFLAVRDALTALAPHAEPHQIVWVEDRADRGIAPALQYGWDAAWVGGDPDDRLAAVPGVRVITTIADLPRALGLRR